MTEDQPPLPDEAIIQLLRERDGLPTTVVLTGDTALTVINIAWGYDPWESQYAHVTTNISPEVDGAAIDFFSTQPLDTIIDPANGTVLYQATS